MRKKTKFKSPVLDVFMVVLCLSIAGHFGYSFWKDLNSSSRRTDKEKIATITSYHKCFAKHIRIFLIIQATFNGIQKFIKGLKCRKLRMIPANLIRRTEQKACFGSADHFEIIKAVA